MNNTTYTPIPTPHCPWCGPVTDGHTCDYEVDDCSAGVCTHEEDKAWWGVLEDVLAASDHETLTELRLADPDAYESALTAAREASDNVKDAYNAYVNQVKQALLNGQKRAALAIARGLAR